jgi:hypothetical protein
MSPLRSLKNALPALLALLAPVAAAGAQMEKRWIDQYRDNDFALAKPAVGAPAADLRLWDVDGRPRSLALERGRTLVLVAGAFT